jgi:hypothetical protein
MYRSRWRSCGGWIYAFDLKNEAHSFGEMPRMQRQQLERPAQSRHKKASHTERRELGW